MRYTNSTLIESIKVMAKENKNIILTHHKDVHLTVDIATIPHPFHCYINLDTPMAHSSLTALHLTLEGFFNFNEPIKGTQVKNNLSPSDRKVFVVTEPGTISLQCNSAVVQPVNVKTIQAKVN